jgi:hypothetical protein
MNSPAFNYVPFVNEAALVVKRKGHVIKGETEAAIAAARRERQAQKNAAKRDRRSKRAA